MKHKQATKTLQKRSQPLENENPHAVTKAEKSYHHGNLRAALIEEGFLLLQQREDADLSLRELARNVGVSANAVYRHFANKEDLMATLAVEGFKRLTDAQIESIVDVSSPVVGILECGRQYIEFATQNPTLFRLMFGRFAFTSPNAQVEKAAEQAFSTLRFVTSKMLNRPENDPEVIRSSAFAWSFVHGLSQLTIDGQFKRHVDNVEQMVGEVLGQAGLLSQLYLQQLGTVAKGDASLTLPVKLELPKGK